MEQFEIDRIIELTKEAGLKPSFVAKRLGMNLTTLRHYLKITPLETLGQYMDALTDIEAKQAYLKATIHAKRRYYMDNPKKRMPRGRPKNT